MNNDRLPHLLVEGRANAVPYTAPRSGGGADFPLPPRDRATHGARLLNDLDQVRRENEAARGIQSPSECPAGIVLEVRSDPGMPLNLDSLENRQQGIELNAVRDDAAGQVATVFVPEGKLAHFVKTIEQYLQENSRTGKPRNKNLVESVSHFGMARLQSFWTDTATLPETDAPIWWELWLRAIGDQDAVLGIYRSQAASIGLQLGDDVIRFADRVVVLCRGTRAQLTSSFELLDLLAEIRKPKENPQPFIEMTPRDQGHVVASLRQRVSSPSLAAPSVCLLDSGVFLHPLLTPVIGEGDLFKHHPDWSLTHSNSHGTEMAGLAAYGERLPELLAGNEPVSLRHRLESVKIWPLPLHQDHPRLYGHITAQAVYRVESHHPDRERVFCLAITHPDGRDLGRPSAWSAELDQICAGVHDEKQRLIFVSAGNTAIDSRCGYPDTNDADSIHDPAQCWNAVTVGAYTDLVHFPTKDYVGWRPLAQPGALSPSSTTSLSWERGWPCKPDIVLEGGNHVIDPTGRETDTPEQMSLLTTAHEPSGRLLVATGDTSAATALAARMGAILQAEYPHFWPETIRGLLVHTAEWTGAMREEFSDNKQGVQNRLRRYGYGVPNLDHALFSARNSLTLIVQDSLQPFDKVEGDIKNKEMRVVDLPWPVDELNNLGPALVTMRVTLSYFIAPSPGRRGWTKRHRYQSHGLRFDVKRPEESEAMFKERLSRAARDEEQAYTGAVGSTDGWCLGPNLRTKGSIHSDWWQGTASQLAASGQVAVFPVTGWWRERKHLNRWSTTARYSLIVSIHTEKTDVDLYTPVQSLVRTAASPMVATEIEIDEE